jgi:hypothetical protein
VTDPQPPGGAGEPGPAADELLVGPSAAERTAWFIVAPLLGAGAFWLLDLLCGGLALLPVPLMHGVFRLLSMPPWWVAAGIGGLLGAGVALIGLHEELTVAGDREWLALTRGGRSRRIARDAVVAAFLDGKHLVLLSVDSRELAREETDPGRSAALQSGFTGLGYPWLTADPHAEEFRLWVHGGPDLPPGGNGLLLARSKLLTNGSRGDLEELRQELGRLGVVVRDAGGKQYVRTVRIG